MRRVAGFGLRWPKLVIVGWLVIVVVLGLAGRGVQHKLLPTQLLVPGTETYHWSELRKGHFGEPMAVLLTGPANAIDRQGPALARALLQRPYTRAVSPWTGGQPARKLRPSPQQALIVLDVDVPKGQNTSTIVPPLQRFIDARVAPPVEPHLSGLAPLGRDINDASVGALHRGEMIALPVLIIVLLLVFRSPIAAAIPLLIALGTLEAGSGILSIVTNFTSLDAVALNLASMIGLALGVDYSLLIVTRFREGLAQGRSARDAASLAAHTAGRTAVFAGTVLIAIMLVAFFLSPGTVLLSASVGAIVVTLLSMIGVALVTPAVVGLVGHRVNKWQLGGSGVEQDGGGDDPSRPAPAARRQQGPPGLRAGTQGGLRPRGRHHARRPEGRAHGPRARPPDPGLRGRAEAAGLREAGGRPRRDR